MYNLIVGAVDGTLGVGRFLEVVEPGLEEIVRPGGVPDTTRLLELPTLLMPEMGDDRSPQVAQAGNVLSVAKTGRDYRFRFLRNPAVPPIPLDQVEAAAARLHIGDWDLTRTRWSVKRADLYQVLLEDNLAGVSAPTAFVIPPGPPDRNRIAVMMPFGAAFNSVWDTLKAAGAAGGWTCQRADDIWEHSVLINDVVSLIARSKVVICDLTGRNANVFYEAGIAHTLGREVVLITQSAEDVPFDLTHHRYVKYLGNEQGLADLQAALTARLQTLMSK